MNELEKTLAHMGIKVVFKPVLCIPVGSNLHRAIFTRKVRKDKETKEVRLTMLFSTVDDLTAQAALTLVIRDTLRGDTTFWDFSTALGGDLEREQVEALHKACKSVGKRARRFFGTSWDNIVRLVEGPTVAPATPKSNRPPAKSA